MVGPASTALARLRGLGLVMMRADPARVVELLEARRGLRLAECNGAFRSQRIVVDGPEDPATGMADASYEVV